jgi:hypothetical protein
MKIQILSRLPLLEKAQKILVFDTAEHPITHAPRLVFHQFNHGEKRLHQFFLFFRKHVHRNLNNDHCGHLPAMPVLKVCGTLKKSGTIANTTAALLMSLFFMTWPPFLNICVNKTTNPSSFLSKYLGGEGGNETPHVNCYAVIYV